MTDKEIFILVNDQLFKNGSCIPNQWKSIHYGGRVVFEAMQPSRGNVRIRKPIKACRENDYGETIYLYNIYRFTNKLELKDEGYIEGLRSEVVC